MKKVLLGLLFCAAGTFAFGQRVVEPVSDHGGYIPDASFKPGQHSYNNLKLNKQDELEGWYNWMDAATKFAGLEYEFYNNSSIWPDSTVLQLWGDGQGGTYAGPVTTHGAGMMLDPKSTYFDDGEIGTVALTRYNWFNWDSVALFYTNYQNFNPGSVDTLIFQFYTTKNSGITKTTFQGSGEKTAFVRYSPTTNLGTGAVYTHKYLLTEADTITGEVKVISVPTSANGDGIRVAGDGLAAFTISYRPGHSYALGDTLDARFNPTKKLNHFRLLMGSDKSKAEGESYNHALRLIKDVRYNKSTNGWNGSFIPGDAWNGENQYLYSAFYIKSGNVGVNDKDLLGYNAGDVYPNPAKATAHVNFELAKAEQVNVTIYNTLGQKINTVADGTYPAGKSRVDFSVEGMKAGVYFYTMTAGAYTKTVKFTVAE